MPEHDNLETARRYLAALERGAVGAELAGFFAPDVIQHEFPNRLTPNGARRDLGALLDGAARGQQVMASQRYDIQSAMADGNRVVLEVEWTGTVAVPIAALPAGGAMRAHFAVFIEFRDGKIVAQRNYDCFEPW